MLAKLHKILEKLDTSENFDILFFIASNTGYLELNNTSVSGTVPIGLNSLSNLGSLKWKFMLIEGTIPPCLYELSSITQFCASFLHVSCFVDLTLLMLGVILSTSTSVLRFFYNHSSFVICGPASGNVLYFGSES